MVMRNQKHFFPKVELAPFSHQPNEVRLQKTNDEQQQLNIGGKASK